MSCSREEIERKRLAAIQKRKNQIQYTSSPLKANCSPGTSSLCSYLNYDKLSTSGQSTSSTNFSKNNYHPYAKPDKFSQNGNVLPVGKVISGTVYLISEDRFEVNPFEFCTPLINVFKTIPSKNYDPQTKLWNFSLDDYQGLMSKVTPLAPHIVLGPIPNYVLQVLREPAVDPNRIDLSPIETTLRNKLMPFQEEGVRFGIAKGGRCMIADDMGLGKTFQALAIASYYRRDWPMLIVTTSSMRETWQSKIHELLPSTPMMNIVCLTGSRDTLQVADRQTEVVICSYKLASTYAQLLQDKRFGVVIIDESHYLKSHKAQCTVALKRISGVSARVILLSGTPALSRVAELYTQLQIIQAKCFQNYTEYGKRYCAGKMTNFGWDMSGQSNLVELQIVLQKKFLIRRTKEQVLTKLEGKTREAVLLDQSLLEFSKEDREGLSLMAETYKCTKSNERHAALLSFFSESAKVKIPAVCKYIKQLLNEDSTTKFLVFAHHKVTLDAICFTLDEARTGYICIAGNTPTSARADLVEKFQHGSQCRCAVLSITAANSGLTLTAASLVIFAELHWNPGILTQAESRAHRIGQSGAVQSRYLLAAGTVDDYMWPMLQGKLNVLNEVGLSKDSFENTTSTLQKSRNNISQYLTPKNKNDYIPGTNILKNSLQCDRGQVESKENNNFANSNAIAEDIDKSFFEDDEGDELLANLDL